MDSWTRLARFVRAHQGIEILHIRKNYIPQNFQNLIKLLILGCKYTPILPSSIHLKKQNTFAGYL